MKLYCAWSSFLLNWDRRIIIYLFLIISSVQGGIHALGSGHIHTLHRISQKFPQCCPPPHLSEVSPMLPSTASLRCFPNVALHNNSQKFPQCCPPPQFSEVSLMLPSTASLRGFPNVALHHNSQKFPQCCL